MIAHVPDAHEVVVPPGVGHAIPHPPQSLIVVSDRSQPSLAIPLQSPQPGSQVPTPQVPVAQLSVARGRSGHAIPQPPQSLAVRRLRSHPSATTPLQSPHPASQVPSAQVPPAHDSVARGTSQLTPHPPQSVSVPSIVSHPSLGTELQSAKPASHAASTQTPVAHDSLAFASAHATPHAPQSLSVEIERSHPFAAIPSQFARPGSQLTIAHAPIAHVSLAYERAHATPHAPQSESVRSDVSHPLPTLPSQSAHPGSHAAIAHAPPLHAATAFAGAQARPQPPQWSRLPAVSTHAAPQSESPGSHAARHARPPPALSLQTGVAPAHATPQPPQSLAVSRLASQPFDAIPSQSAQPGSQATIAQLPLAHVSLPCASAHVVPHAPQLDSVSSGVSQPSLAIALQSPRPGSHAAIPHPAGVHPGAPRSTAPHASPHAVQSVVVPSATSHPSATSPLQSAQPGSHAETRHVPPLHDPVACEGAQGEPHAPQCAIPTSGVSHPSAASSLQSPHPGAQRSIVHSEVKQVGVA